MFLKHYSSLGLLAQCIFHKHAAMMMSKSLLCFVFQLFTQTLQSHPPHPLSGLVESWLSSPKKQNPSVISWQTRVIYCKIVLHVVHVCLKLKLLTHVELRKSFSFFFYQIDSITQSGMILNTVWLVIGIQILLGLDNRFGQYFPPYQYIQMGCALVTVFRCTYICMCSGYLL